MIPFFIPLAISGIIVAIWRDYTMAPSQIEILDAPKATVTLNDNTEKKHIPSIVKKDFDDMKELYHYKSVSWYALAFSASGKWFYPPASIVSIPLLTYNSYYFIKIIRESTRVEQKSPLTIFEVIAVFAPLLTGSPMTTAFVLQFSFGIRKLLLQAGNISNNIGLSNNFNPKFMRIWVLREGVEIETSIVELQDDDIIVLHSGDIVAIKGKIIKGKANLYQYSLRKKMKLITKQKGDTVFPFTKLESGFLHIQT